MKTVPFAKLSFTKNEQTLITVERTLSDMRRGVPVVVTDTTEGSLVVLATEAIGQQELDRLAQSSSIPLSLIVTGKRAHFLFPDSPPAHSIRIENPQWEIGRIQELSGIGSDITATLSSPFTEASSLENNAIALAKLAELLPSIITLRLGSSEDGLAYAAANELLVVPTEAITTYKQSFAFSMQEISRAPLRLEATENAALVAFRSSGSGREHYAIIIGNPDPSAPLARIHSSCYTGDLLGSLHCDCGDQLKEAIRFMAAHEGGIILYLMQEGRGIGLTNKLRTYALQAQGYDTVDANEMLGFDDDERLFLPAVKMLESLDIPQVKLLTNNPRKAKGLEEHGIKVVECVPHIMTANKHNKAYLHTKATRLGHNFSPKE